MNRRILDRKTISYKRNIYDLTPEKEIEKENDILDIETKEENKGTMNDNKETIETE
jgi:hypothetical protein